MATSTKIEITAVDKTQKAFAGVKTSLSSVDKAASQIKGSLGGLQTAVGALAGVAGFGSLISTFRDVGDRLGKVSSQLNITTEALQALRFAAEQSGVSNSQLDTALQRLNRRLGDFVTTGTGPAADAFERLGIATTDSTGAVRRADEVFFDIADAISKIESPAEKASLAFKFFDRAGADLLVMLNSGRSGLEDYRKQLIANGAVIEEEAIRNTEAFNDAMNLLERSIRGKVVNALAGPLKTALETVNENFGLVTTAVGALTVALIAAAAPAAIGAIVAGITNIIGVMTTLQAIMLANPITAIATGLTALAAWFVSSNWDAISGGFDEMKAKIGGLSDEAKASELTRLTGKLDSLNQALETQKLAEKSALGPAGKKARQEQIATIEKEISQTQELIGLLTKKKQTQTAIIPPVQKVEQAAKTTLDFSSAQLKADRIQARLKAEQTARLEEQKRVQDFLAEGAQKVYDIAKNNSLVTGQASEASRDFFQSVNDRLAAEKESEKLTQERLDLAKALFLTNMEQGAYTEQQAFELASQLGLVNEMVALQQVLNDRAAEAYTQKVMEAEIEADLDAFLLERVKKQGKFNLLLDDAKKKFNSINSAAKSSAGALVNNSVFQGITGAAGASGSRAMNIAKATAEGGIQGGLMALVLSNAKVQEALGKLFDAIFALIDPLIDLLVPALDALTPAIEELKPVFEAMKPYFTVFGAAMKTQAVAIGQFFKGFAELVKVFESNTKFVRDFGKELEKVGPRIEQLGHKLEEFGQGLLDGVKTIGETLLTGIKEFIEGLGTELLNLPGNITTAIVNGLAGLPQAIYDAIKGLFSFGGGGGSDGLLGGKIIPGFLKDGGYIPKAKGGMLVGASHSSGGQLINAEGGEFIFSRKAVSRIGAARLSNMNNGGMADYAPIEVNIYDGTGQRISEYDSALRVEIKERAARNSQFAAVA